MTLARATGVDLLAGAGLADALRGVRVFDQWLAIQSAAADSVTHQSLRLTGEQR